MKRVWSSEELIEHWSLFTTEIEFVNQVRTDKNRLGLAVLFKWFQYEGRFPKRKQDVPMAVVSFLAKQLEVPVDSWGSYHWESRTGTRHRTAIRDYLGYRAATSEDSIKLSAWLATEILPHQRQAEALVEAVYEQCRVLLIEPPSSGSIERLIRSAIRTADQQFFEQTSAKLSPQTKTQLDSLLTTDPPSSEQEGEETEAQKGRGYSVLHQLKRAPSALKLDTFLTEIAKLQQIEALELPDDLFTQVSPKVLASHRQRIAVEDLHEIRRHPEMIRYTLLATFCWQRRQEIIDTLVELLIDLIHRINVRAERKVEKEVFKEFKRVRGKGRLLYQVAEASMGDPDGIVREVIYPIAGEQTLQDVITEFKVTGTYEHQVRLKMRGSYGCHYRRIVPALIKALRFKSNNEIYQPLIEALTLLEKYVDSTRREYPATEYVPLEGVVPKAWRGLVIRKTKRGEERINRISYELCVLRSLREQLRSKEIWVKKADRFRNPDEDLPADFPEKRLRYYAELKQPLDAGSFIRREKQALKQALSMFNRGLPQNKEVKLTQRNGKGWISVTPLEPVEDPLNLRHFKAAVKQQWGWVSLLDMAKEADFRIDFTRFFKSATAHEILPRPVLQKRLLLCLYALGTNTGLSRVSAGDEQVSYRDLLYVKRRFINKDSLRVAIRAVANAILQVRHPEIWGTDITACASDGKKFGAWDQNLLTEWHIRYRGPGVMVYWHVEKKSLCIYSQVKRCSSSEVAAMIEGVLRHCTDMEVTKNYVDTHGQSEVAFAFCHLLGFQLMPRLKGIGRQKLYRPESGDRDNYPHLQSILSRNINWSSMTQQYDEMIKFSTALRLGTAESESILRRFTRNGPMHPTYQAFLELGKARRTVFLCSYLHDKTVRQEVQGGLNVIENWNSANGFIYYGKSGEIASNNPEEQELAVLSLHLLQICLVYINTLMLQQIWQEQAWGERLEAEDLRALTPLFYTHVNPYGEFRLDMHQQLDIA